MILERLLSPEIIWAVIPVSAIVIGGVIAILKLVLRHRERQAMIDAGLHPDYPPEDDGDLDETTYHRHSG